VLERTSDRCRNGLFSFPLGKSRVRYDDATPSRSLRPCPEAFSPNVCDHRATAQLLRGLAKTSRAETECTPSVCDDLVLHRRSHVSATRPGGWQPSAVRFFVQAYGHWRRGLQIVAYSRGSCMHQINRARACDTDVSITLLLHASILTLLGNRRISPVALVFMCSVVCWRRDNTCPPGAVLPTTQSRVELILGLFDCFYTEFAHAHMSATCCSAAAHVWIEAPRYSPRETASFLEA